MGNICSLCGTRSKATVKLILSGGELIEFPGPVKVCSLLQKHCDSFICDSDEMDFDELVTAMNGDEELQPGQLYFELPSSWLTQRLQPEDMACLAVKASEALTRTDQIKCGCYRTEKVNPGVTFYNEDYAQLKQPRLLTFERRPNELVALKKKGGTAGGVGNPNCGRFTATLSVIHEEEF